METVTHFRATSFGKISDGACFVFEHEGLSCVALRARAPASTLCAVLWPTPRILRETVVSGKSIITLEDVAFIPSGHLSDLLFDKPPAHPGYAIICPDRMFLTLQDDKSGLVYLDISSGELLASPEERPISALITCWKIVRKVLNTHEIICSFPPTQTEALPK
jgi:hypothetical protein